MGNPEKSGLSEINAVQVIHEIEEGKDLLQYKVEGYCVWPLMRFDIEAALVQLPFAGKRHFSRFEQALIALHDLPKLFCIKKSPIVVKTYSSARLIEENGRKKDVFFDDLLDGCKNVFRIEGINSRQMYKERKRAKVPAVMTSLTLDILAGGVSLLPGLTPDFSDMAKSISSALSIYPNLTRFTPQKILRKVKFFYWAIKLYTWLLKKTGANQLLIADPGEYLICAAARKLNIPIFELQHGLVGPEYNSFYSWTRYASEYKTQLPIPNKLLLFSEYWKQKLQSTDFWIDELRVTGSILLDSYRKNRRTHCHEGCNILLTSQGLDRDQLIMLIREFELLSCQSGSFQHHLYIKLHPIFDCEKSVFNKDLGDCPNVSVFEANDQPSTFDLMTFVDIHWSISSACHYDALGMGIPTVILALQTYESVLSLHEDGYALLAKDGRQLFELTRDWKSHSVPEDIREYFYQSGALENVRKEIGLV